MSLQNITVFVLGCAGGPSINYWATQTGLYSDELFDSIGLWMESKSVRIEVLPILGATLCLVALAFFKWEERGEFYDGTGFSVLYSDFLPSIVLIVLAGAVISYVNSVGWIAICGGVSIYYIHATSVSDWLITNSYENHMSPTSLGPLLATLAGFTVLIGFFRPVSLCLPIRYHEIRFRILSIIPHDTHRDTSRGPGSHRFHHLVERVNLLSIAGAFIGLLSLTFIWARYRIIEDGRDMTQWFVLKSDTDLYSSLGNLLFNSMGSYDSIWLHVSGWCVLVGSLMALFTIIGGTVQLLGASIFALDFANSQSIYPIPDSTRYVGDPAFGLGLYLCYIGGILVISSAVLMWVGRSHNQSLSRSPLTFAIIPRNEPSQLQTGPSIRGVRAPVNVNILCLLGAALAISSLFQAWIVRNDISYIPLSIFHLPLVLFGLDFLIPFVILFMIGAAFSLLSPIGGFVQLIGLIGFAMMMSSGYDDADLHIGYGFLIAIFACAFTIMSGFVVLEKQIPNSKIPLLSSLATVGASDLKSEAGRTVSRVKLHMSRYSMRGLRVNALCLIGAIIGLLALSLDWSSLSLGNVGFSDSPLWVFESSLRSYSITVFLSHFWFAIPFAMGVLIAFYSPIGGLLEGAGLLLFLEEFRFHSYAYSGIPTYTTFSIGFTLAVMSFILVISSIVFPYGLAKKDTHPWFLDRLFVWRISNVG